MEHREFQIRVEDVLLFVLTDGRTPLKPQSLFKLV
jgi:hypothetical protein